MSADSESAADTDDEEPVATIETAGDPIRAWGKLFEPIADEYQLVIDADGLHVRVVDPANVGMVVLDAPAEGFESFDPPTDELRVGLNLERFRSLVNEARKGRWSSEGDPVSIEVLQSPPRMRVTVEREDTGLERETTWFTIDPDAVRQEPDPPTNTPVECADPDVEALAAACDMLTANHRDLRRDGSDLIVATAHADDNDLDEDRVRLQDCAWQGEDALDADSNAADPGAATFSADYLDNITSALDTAKADRVTLRWAIEFPVFIQFEYEDWGFSGKYVVAPRISGDSS